MGSPIKRVAQIYSFQKKTPPKPLVPKRHQRLSCRRAGQIWLPSCQTWLAAVGSGGVATDLPARSYGWLGQIWLPPTRSSHRRQDQAIPQPNLARGWPGPANGDRAQSAAARSGGAFFFKKNTVVVRSSRRGMDLSVPQPNLVGGQFALASGSWTWPTTARSSRAAHKIVWPNPWPRRQIRLWPAMFGRLDMVTTSAVGGGGDQIWPARCYWGMRGLIFFFFFEKSRSRTFI